MKEIRNKIKIMSHGFAMATLLIVMVIFQIPQLFAGGNNQSQGTRGQQGPIDLEIESSRVVLNIYLPFGSEFYDNRLREFTRLNPNIRINQVDISGNVDQRLLTMAASGTAPDIFIMNPASMLNYVRQDALLPLDDFFAASTVVNRSDLMPINDQVYAWNGSEFGSGNIYGFASGWSPDLMMFYNKDMFDAAGLEYPSKDTPMTWSEFRAVLQALGQQDDQGNWTRVPTIFDHVPVYHMYQMILANGGRIFNEDGTRAVIADDPRTVEAIRFFMSLQTGPDAVMPFYEDPVPMIGFQLFQSGRSAIAWGGQWIINQYLNAAPNLNWGIAPVPIPDVNGQRVALVAGMIGQVISSTSRYPRAAWRLFEFLLTEDQRQIAEANLAVPINTNFTQYLNSPNTPANRRAVNEFIINESQNYAVFYPRSPFVAGSFVDMQFTEKLREVRFGITSLDVAIREVQNAINVEISDWQ